MNLCACDERSTGQNLNVRQPSSNMKRAAPHGWSTSGENDIADTLSRGALNMAQITLACVFGLEARIPEFRWRPNRRRGLTAFPHAGRLFRRHQVTATEQIASRPLLAEAV